MSPSHVTSLSTTRAAWVAFVARRDRPTSKEHRRRHPRAQFAGLTRIAYERFDGTPHVEECAVLNVSEGGLLLRGRFKVPLEELVAIQLDMGQESLHLCGQVMHCTPTVVGYKIGIKLIFSVSDNRDRSIE
jgi:hypothetical protein